MTEKQKIALEIIELDHEEPSDLTREVMDRLERLASLIDFETETQDPYDRACEIIICACDLAEEYIEND